MRLNISLFMVLLSLLVSSPTRAGLDATACERACTEVSVECGNFWTIASEERVRRRYEAYMKILRFISGSTKPAREVKAGKVVEELEHYFLTNDPGAARTLINSIIPQFEKDFWILTQARRIRVALSAADQNDPKVKGVKKEIEEIISFHSSEYQKRRITYRMMLLMLKEYLAKSKPGSDNYKLIKDVVDNTGFRKAWQPSLLESVAAPRAAMAPGSQIMAEINQMLEEVNYAIVHDAEDIGENRAGLIRPTPEEIDRLEARGGDRSLGDLPELRMAALTVSFRAEAKAAAVYTALRLPVFSVLIKKGFSFLRRFGKATAEQEKKLNEVGRLINIQTVQFGKTNKVVGAYLTATKQRKLSAAAAKLKEFGLALEGGDIFLDAWYLNANIPEKLRVDLAQHIAQSDADFSQHVEAAKARTANERKILPFDKSLAAYALIRVGEFVIEYSATAVSAYLIWQRFFGQGLQAGDEAESATDLALEDADVFVDALAAVIEAGERGDQEAKAIVRDIQASARVFYDTMVKPAVFERVPDARGI